MRHYSSYEQVGKGNVTQRILTTACRPNVAAAYSYIAHKLIIVFTFFLMVRKKFRRLSWHKIIKSKCISINKILLEHSHKLVVDFILCTRRAVTDRISQSRGYFAFQRESAILVGFVSFWHIPVTWDEGTLTEELPPSDWHVIGTKRDTPFLPLCGF